MACSGSVAHALLSGAVTDAIGVHPIFGVFVAPPMSELLLLLVSSWVATAAVQTVSIQLFTTCSCATVVLTMLRENRGDFDVIISDVHMPDMDGFRLLELVGLEMDLPVITTIST